jgi:hypothetical protein
VVISLLGDRVGWYRAVSAGRGTEVLIAGERLDPQVRRVEGEEAFRVFSAFERRNRFLMPLARPVISCLTGFRYDGSASAKQRLLEKMPLLGLRPAEAADRPA